MIALAVCVEYICADAAREYKISSSAHWTRRHIKCSAPRLLLSNKSGRNDHWNESDRALQADAWEGSARIFMRRGWRNRKICKCMRADCSHSSMHILSLRISFPCSEASRSESLSTGVASPKCILAWQRNHLGECNETEQAKIAAYDCRGNPNRCRTYHGRRLLTIQ